MTTGPLSVVSSQLPMNGDASSFGDAQSSVMACFQCRKCTSGCPVAGRADIKPHELVRLVQLGQREEVLASRMIWECTSCQTCATRCPQEVSIAAMNDMLRRISRAEREASRGVTVVIFNEIFLRTVRRLGRIHEMGLMASFKLRTRRFFDDIGKAPMMLRKGKLTIFPKRVPGRAARQALFDRVAQAGGKKP